MDGRVGELDERCRFFGRATTIGVAVVEIELVDVADGSRGIFVATMSTDSELPVLAPMSTIFSVFGLPEETSSCWLVMSLFELRVRFLDNSTGTGPSL